jgi:hypothetical protein
MAKEREKTAWGIFLVVCIFLGLTGVGPIITGVLMVLFVLLGVMGFLKPAVEQQEQQFSPSEDIERSPISTPLLESLKRPRILYLDNLKTFLTVIVVLHHSACCFYSELWICGAGLYKQSFALFGSAFTLLNQSYFMSLFFGVAGYFVPSSLDKKGAESFLKDRWIRLGYPFMFMALIGFPFVLNLPIIWLGLDPFYFPIPGPLWFVGWLMLMSFVYATTHNGPELIIPFPSPTKIVVVTIIATFLQIVCFIVAGGSTGFMPITFGSMPFDILFFWMGIAARRSRWLDDPKTENSISTGSGTGTENDDTTGSLLEFQDKYRILLRTLVVVLASLWIFGITWTYQKTQANPFFHAYQGDDDQHDDDDSDSPSVTTPLVMSTLALSGPFTVAFSLVLLDLSRTYLEFKSEWSTWLAGSAYAVYIVHALYVTLFFLVWIEIMRGAGNDVYFRQGSDRPLALSTSRVSNDGWFWGGFIFTATLALAASWVTGAQLRKLEIFKNIL